MDSMHGKYNLKGKSRYSEKEREVRQILCPFVQ